MKPNSRMVPYFLVGLLFVLMVRTVELTLTSSSRRHEQGRWVAHTLEAIARIESVTTLMSELRYRERNQALGLDGGSPEPYTVAKADVDEALEALRGYTSDNPVQRATIISVTNEWNGYLADSRLALASPKRADGLAKILSADHRLLYDRASRLLAEMRTEEVKLLGQRQSSLRDSLDASDKAIVASGVVMALSLMGIGLLLQGENRARRKADEAMVREQAANLRLEAANALLEKLAGTDGLTGLGNQRAFRERLEPEVLVAQSLDRPLSLLLFDIDRFKDYNDSFGHPEGDRALRAVARAIDDYAPAGSFVARHGGEEFALLLTGKGTDEAVRAAEKIRQAVEAIRWPLRPVTVSIGVATLEKGRTSDDLMEVADRALYAAKAHGRNQTVRADRLPQPVQDSGGFVAAPIPANEAARLAAVEASGLAAPWPILEFDALAEAVSRVFGTPVGLVTIVGADAQTFKAHVGIELRGTSRDVSFCAHAMLEEEPMVVLDASADDRFAENPLVTGAPEIRFYAGAAIRSTEGLPLGALCAIDTIPRTVSPEQLRMLEGLADEASRIVHAKTVKPPKEEQAARSRL